MYGVDMVCIISVCHKKKLSGNANVLVYVKLELEFRSAATVLNS